MRSKLRALLVSNMAFAWLALSAGLLLLIPAIAMQFTASVNWGALDFVVMGALLVGAGSLFILVARRIPQNYWLAVGVVIALGLVWLWAELAVGVFTDLGS